MSDGLNMDSKLTAELFQKIGGLDSKAETNNIAINEVKKQITGVQEAVVFMSGEQVELKSNMNQVKERVTGVETHIGSLNSVNDKMRDVGINYKDAEEHQQDMYWLRQQRYNSMQRSGIYLKIIATLGVVICISFIGFVGMAVKNAIIEDIKHENVTRR